MLRWLGKIKFMTFYFQYLLMLDLFRWHKTRGWTTFSKLIKGSWSLLPLFPCIDKLLIFINWSEKLRSIKRFSKTNSDHGVFPALIFYHDVHMTFFLQEFWYQNSTYYTHASTVWTIHLVKQGEKKVWLQI